MHYSDTMIFISFVIGFVMTWGVGANDLANIMSTTIGSKSVTVKQAIIIAIIFEFAGAVLGGGHVTNTIRAGIINSNVLSHSPYVLINGMTATLLAGATWMLFASVVGMPVSITNAIVGALVGFGVVVLGIHAVHWHNVGKIAASWVLSPTIAGIVAYLLFNTIRRSIFDTSSPSRCARRFTPIYLFLVGVVLGDMTVLKGLAHFHLVPSFYAAVLITILTAFAVVVMGYTIMKKIPNADNVKRYLQYEYVEKLFAVLMIFTACAMVFAHGSNDVAIAMGPIAAIISIVENHGQISNTFPSWILWFGCVGVVTGLIMYGRKVIATVGSNITALTPSRAFAATLASAGTVIISTSLGIPVSATQTLVGGVLGVGLARGLGALNITIVRNIFLSWCVTVPAAAGLAIFYFFLLKSIFGG
jgi:inorganic phosphate transporter, PiT family